MMASRHSEGDIMAKVIIKSLLSPHLQSGTINALKKLLQSQQKQELMHAMITKALQFTDLSEFLSKTVRWESQTTVNADKIRDIIWEKLHSRHMDYLIMYGINKLTTARQIDYFIVEVIKELLASEQLGDNIKAACRETQPSQEQGDAMMETVSSTLNSMLLDGSLVDTLIGQIKHGYLDDIVMSTVTQLLHSGKWDEILLRAIMALNFKVRSKR